MGINISRLEENLFLFFIQIGIKCIRIDSWFGKPVFEAESIEQKQKPAPKGAGFAKSVVQNSQNAEVVAEQAFRVILTDVTTAQLV